MTRVSHNKRGSRSKQGPITETRCVGMQSVNPLQTMISLKTTHILSCLYLLCFTGQGDTNRVTFLQRNLDWMSVWLYRQMSGHGNGLTQNQRKTKNVIGNSVFDMCSVHTIWFTIACNGIYLRIAVRTGKEAEQTIDRLYVE